MLKIKLFSTLLLLLIILTACGENEKVTTQADNHLSVSNSADASPDSTNEIDPFQPKEESEQTEEGLESTEQNITNFEAKLLIDVNSYQDQLNEEQLPILKALENNLIALLEHDSDLFRSGFVTEYLADNMMFYYSEHFQYRFTEVESVEPNMSYGNVHITLLGQRLDASTETIEDVRMMYAFRQNEQGIWMIYNID